MLETGKMPTTLFIFRFSTVDFRLCLRFRRQTNPSILVFNSKTQDASRSLAPSPLCNETNPHSQLATRNARQLQTNPFYPSPAGTDLVNKLFFAFEKRAL